MPDAIWEASTRRRHAQRAWSFVTPDEKGANSTRLTPAARDESVKSGQPDSRPLHILTRNNMRTGNHERGHACPRSVGFSRTRCTLGVLRHCWKAGWMSRGLERVRLRGSGTHSSHRRQHPQPARTADRSLVRPDARQPRPQLSHLSSSPQPSPALTSGAVYAQQAPWPPLSPPPVPFPIPITRQLILRPTHTLHPHSDPLLHLPLPPALPRHPQPFVQLYAQFSPSHRGLAQWVAQRPEGQPQLARPRPPQLRRPPGQAVERQARRRHRRRCGGGDWADEHPAQGAHGGGAADDGRRG